MFRHELDGKAFHGIEPTGRSVDRTVHVLLTAVLAIRGKIHILGQFTGQSRAEQVEGGRLQAQGEFVGVTQTRRPSPVDAGVEPRMMAGERFPLRTEDTHDPSAEQNVGLTLRTVHVAFAPIPPIVHDERDPKTRVERKPVQAPPSESDQNGMEDELMSSEQETFRTDFHNRSIVESIYFTSLANRSQCDFGMTQPETFTPFHVSRSFRVAPMNCNRS